MECNLHLRGLRMFVDLSSKKGGKKKRVGWSYGDFRRGNM